MCGQSLPPSARCCLEHEGDGSLAEMKRSNRDIEFAIEVFARRQEPDLSL
jgi:hypothetical protein